MSKLLVFYTTIYPNDHGEVFVENEMRILEKYFEKIIIICAVKKNNTVIRYIPANAEVYVFPETLNFGQKLFGIRFVFMRIFWNEFFFVKKHLKLKFNFLKLKILYIDLLRGYYLHKYTNTILKKRLKSTTIYCYSYWSDYEAIACAFLKKDNPEIKAFARNHRWDLYFYAAENKYLPLRKFIYDHLDAVFCIAEDGIDYIKNELKFEHNIFSVSKIGTYKKISKNKPFVKTNSLLFISCSNLVPVKRVDLIIDALALINEFNINWIHFGEGILKESLIENAKKLSTMKNIKFEFKGQTKNEDVLAFYEENQVDFLLNVSKSEGIPVSIMEAMSFGIPVIATAVGGTPEIVKHQITGFLLPENPNPNDIVEAIKYYYSMQTEETIHLRENAYNKWCEDYDADKNYAKFIDKILSI